MADSCMKREDVYALIDGERDYQDRLPATRTDGRTSVEGFLVMMSHYLDEAITAWTMNPGDDAALDIIRKVAGIAVHCMEKYGAPKRNR